MESNESQNEQQEVEEDQPAFRARVYKDGMYEGMMAPEFGPLAANSIFNIVRDACRLESAPLEVRGILTRARDELAEVLKDRFVGEPKPSLKYRNPCLLKAGDDEPIFVLRAKDSLAPEIVREWVKLAKLCGKTPPEKLAEAEELAVKMEKWGEQNESRLPD